jgi:hypothetical protein
MAKRPTPMPIPKMVAIDLQKDRSDPANTDSREYSITLPYKYVFYLK